MKEAVALIVQTINPSTGVPATLLRAPNSDDKVAATNGARRKV